MESPDPNRSLLFSVAMWSGILMLAPASAVRSQFLAGAPLPGSAMLAAVAQASAVPLNTGTTAHSLIISFEIAPLAVSISRIQRGLADISHDPPPFLFTLPPFNGRFTCIREGFISHTVLYLFKNHTGLRTDESSLDKEVRDHPSCDLIHSPNLADTVSKSSPSAVDAIT